MVKPGTLIVLLFLSIVVPALYGNSRISEVEKTYDNKCDPQVDWTPAFSPMQNQSEVLLNWGIGLSGSIIALITTKFLPQFRTIRLLYFLFAPALSFLISSIWAAVVFQERLSYLLLNKSPDSCATLNKHLLSQNDLFLCAIAILALVAIICLVEILLGLVRLEEPK